MPTHIAYPRILLRNRFVERRLQLVVNRVKSQAAPLKQCAFLGFQIGAQGRAVWTAKAHARFKQRVREITRRNRGTPGAGRP